MSEDVVVKTGLALCGHGQPPPAPTPVPPPFSLTLNASQSILHVKGVPVLLHKDFTDAPIACTVQVPCEKVMTFTSVGATVLTVGGEPVALKSTNGVTKAGTFKVHDAGQAVLKAK